MTPAEAHNASKTSSISSFSSCPSYYKRRDAIIEIPAEALKPTKSQSLRSGWQDFVQVISWQQAFQIIVATCTFIAGAGVGQQVLHDPLATAEGVLNAPVVVSQIAVILTNIWRLHHPNISVIPQLLPLIEHITIFASAFALLSHIFLSLLFSLPRFPASVEIISSYGGATLLHFLLIVIHFIQAIVLKWEDITAFLLLQVRRVCDQIYTWHPDSKMENALKLPDRRPGSHGAKQTDPEKGDAHVHTKEVGSGEHAAEKVGGGGCCAHGGGGTGFAAIMADIIAHAVSLPTFFTAWVLQRCHIHVNDLAVAWTVDISTLILLACIMHSSTKAGIKAWKAIALAASHSNDVAHAKSSDSGGGGGNGACGHHHAHDLKPGVEVVR